MATTVINSYSWLNNLREPWQRELIAEFVVPFRTRGELTPCGPAGKTVFLDKFQPIPIITFYDAWSLLWSYAHRPSKNMTVEEQINYLHESQERLVQSIMIIQPDPNLRPATVNLTYSDQVSKRKGKNGEIHDGFVDSLSSISENGGNRYKDGEHADITLGKEREGCPNIETIGKIQASFGKLLRVGSLGGDVWKTIVPRKTCRLVHADSRFTSKGTSIIENPTTMSQVQLCEGKNGRTSRCNDALILVDAFEDNSRIATLVDYEVLDSDPKELIYHIRCIANFGFDHIIIIGETDYGMIFLDCYGRVFLWENDSQMLWPLGNSPEEASKRLVKGVDQLRWFEDNGTVYEYITKWEDYY